MYTEKIPTLLLDSLAGQLSDADAARLQRWLAESAANRELAERLNDSIQLSHDFISYAGLDLAKTRKKLDLLLSKSTTIRRPRRSIGTREAIRTSLLVRNAAAVILRAATFIFSRAGQGRKGNNAGTQPDGAAAGTKKITGTEVGDRG